MDLRLSTVSTRGSPTEPPQTKGDHDKAVPDPCQEEKNALGFKPSVRNPSDLGTAQYGFAHLSH